MTNAELIKQIRREHKLNTKQLGERLGVSGRTVEDWEQGRRNPTKTAILLIDVLFSGPI